MTNPIKIIRKTVPSAEDMFNCLQSTTDCSNVFLTLSRAFQAWDDKELNSTMTSLDRFYDDYSDSSCMKDVSFFKIVNCVNVLFWFQLSSDPD